MEPKDTLEQERAIGEEGPADENPNAQDPEPPKQDDEFEETDEAKE